MKIQLLSDLHLETHPHFVPRPAVGADVLVLDPKLKPKRVFVGGVEFNANGRVQ